MTGLSQNDFLLSCWLYIYLQLSVSREVVLKLFNFSPKRKVVVTSELIQAL